MAERIVRIYGPITDATAQAAVEHILTLNDECHAPIHAYVYSPGGHVPAGLTLIDTMRHVESPVFTVAMGMTASMAAVILAAGQRGHRYALPHTRIMIHDAFGGAHGRLEQLQSAVESQRELESEILQILADTTGQSRSVLRRLMRRDRYLRSHEACNYGLIDHVL